MSDQYVRQTQAKDNTTVPLRKTALATRHRRLDTGYIASVKLKRAASIQRRSKVPLRTPWGCGVYARGCSKLSFGSGLGAYLIGITFRLVLPTRRSFLFLPLGFVIRQDVSKRCSTLDSGATTCAAAAEYDRRMRVSADTHLMRHCMY